MIEKMITMPTTIKKSAAQPAAARPADIKPPEIAAALVPDTLATLKVNPETWLAQPEVDLRRKQNDRTEWAAVVVPVEGTRILWQR